MIAGSGRLQCRRLSSRRSRQLGFSQASQAVASPARVCKRVAKVLGNTLARSPGRRERATAGLESLLRVLFPFDTLVRASFHTSHSTPRKHSR